MKPLSEKQCQDLYDDAHQAGMIAADQFTYDGWCGFAHVSVHPAHCNFAKWLVKNKLASYSQIGKGVRMYVGDFDQSLDKKTAYAGAFSRVLIDAGVKSKSHSKID